MVNSCETQPNGDVCLPKSNWSTCKPWDISNQTRTNCYADSLIEETVSIAGAQVNVFKLLGVHEQTSLTDLTGTGTAISSGDAPHYPAKNAFSKYTTEWRSRQVGEAVPASAFIGYDFGFLKTTNGREKYGIDTSVRHLITTIKIKQSNKPESRVLKARIERSDDGKQWYGVSVVNLPNDNQLNTIHFKNSVPSRYWRVRPITFQGAACDSWGVQALELIDYQQTLIDNIQDKILMENRDRDYANQSITIKGYYDLINVSTELSKFGIEIPTASYSIRVPFNMCVNVLGRPIVIGDIIELPSETQYTPDLRPIKRYLEVTDVTWDAASYTPGWQPTMLLLTTQPALASQETQDIFGDLAKHIDSSGLFDNDDGNNTKWQDFSTIDQTIAADANTDLPERGAEGSSAIRQFEQSELDALAEQAPNLNKFGLNPTGLYVEDAMPPNNAPYTQDDAFPDSPKDGDYHRMTYTGLAQNVPTRLYRWSTTKGRWVYLESDKRALYNPQKPILTEYLTSPNRVPPQDIK